MSENRIIVVTGGTRGIGHGLCHYLLNAGCKVVFTGTSEKSVTKAKESFDAQYPKGNSLGIALDVRNKEQCDDLIERVKSVYGGMDMFVCNAGIDINHHKFHQVPVEKYISAIEINLIGAMNCSHSALRYFDQKGSGSLFLMEGFGSDGRMQDMMTSYGTSKYGIRYFAKSLAREYESSGIVVGTLSPGMVTTELLLDGLKDMDEEKRNKTIKVYNIMADTVETVTEFLGKGILDNTKQAPQIYWLTGKKIAFRFFKANFKKRQIIDPKDY